LTIDERLDRLTERHEALTQTVELLTRDLQSIRDFSMDIAAGTARLLHIAQIREYRIARLEGGEHEQ
jgi:archaellum component FlaC